MNLEEGLKYREEGGMSRDHEEEKGGTKRKDPNCIVLSRDLEF